MRATAHGAGRAELPGGDRPRIQIVTVRDLIAGPNLGLLTTLNTIDAAEAARKEARKRPAKRPTAEQLRKEPPLPPMQIKGGKQAKVQPPLNLVEPLLVVQPKKSRA